MMGPFRCSPNACQAASGWALCPVGPAGGRARESSCTGNPHAVPSPSGTQPVGVNVYGNAVVARALQTHGQGRNRVGRGGQAEAEGRGGEQRLCSFFICHRHPHVPSSCTLAHILPSPHGGGGVEGRPPSLLLMGGQGQSLLRVGSWGRTGGSPNSAVRLALGLLCVLGHHQIRPEGPPSSCEVPPGDVEWVLG